jgi:hypothetical protein
MSDEKFNRFPADFMKDIFIQVHLFDNPERDEHPDFINYEMKHDLFHRAFDRISKIEYAYLNQDEEWFKLKKIEKCNEADEDSFFYSIYRSQYIDENDQ